MKNDSSATQQRAIQNPFVARRRFDRSPGLTHVPTIVTAHVVVVMMLMAAALGIYQICAATKDF